MRQARLENRALACTHYGFNCNTDRDRG